ncbi:MAG: RNase H, partial [Deltaproteobacteria bacterium]
QLQGSYRVRQPHLRPLYQRALEMLRRFEQAELVHVPREENLAADRLANRAIDEGE